MSILYVITCFVYLIFHITGRIIIINNINSFQSCNIMYFISPPLDDCASAPCKHGQCIDAVNSYSCQCHTGFTGSDCKTNIGQSCQSCCLYFVYIFILQQIELIINLIIDKLQHIQHIIHCKNTKIHWLAFSLFHDHQQIHARSVIFG